jgi:hypothetical protein
MTITQSCTHRLAVSAFGSSAAPRRSTPAPKPFVARSPSKQHRVAPACVSPLEVIHPVIAALDIDWSDPDAQLGLFGGFLGLTVGIGAPIFYTYRDRLDEERLEELRALNRATKEETGEYLTPVGLDGCY